jgi:hypothetical protein
MLSFLIILFHFLAILTLGTLGMGMFLECLSLAPEVLSGASLAIAHTFNVIMLVLFTYVMGSYACAVIDELDAPKASTRLTDDDVFMRNIPTVRETYGKSACTCDSATCKGAHWKHWTCPSPDMDVETWERMKLAHVRPVSARRVRRSPRVHAIARVSVIAVSGVPVA